MKDTYRERIKEEQKKLSPSQVFFSEGYRKLFRDLANEVAKTGAAAFVPEYRRRTGRLE